MARRDTTGIADINFVSSVPPSLVRTLACLFKTQIMRCLPAAQRFALLALLEKNLSRAYKAQAQINSPRFIEQEKLNEFILEVVPGLLPYELITPKKRLNALSVRYSMFISLTLGVAKDTGLCERLPSRIIGDSTGFEPTLSLTQIQSLRPRGQRFYEHDLHMDGFSSNLTHGIWSHVRLKRSKKVDDEAQNERLTSLFHPKEAVEQDPKRSETLEGSQSCGRPSRAHNDPLPPLLMARPLTQICFSLFLFLLIRNYTSTYTTFLSPSTKL
ncbi:hypothetical protein J6590_042975 [Homalodisca vitripennis]|nr:hypothetical protein J6590_042975 [Homalodisca vitripennis]